MLNLLEKLEVDIYNYFLSLRWLSYLQVVFSLLLTATSLLTQRQVCRGISTTSLIYEQATIRLFHKRLKEI